MSRIPLITERSGLDDRRTAVFDAVVESRGSMIRPYEVLLHAPGMAMPAAELGGQIRYHGVLSDHDRELAILTAGSIANCQFEWDSHVDIARAAGVREEVLDHLRGGEDVLEPSERVIVGFVRELVASSTVSDATFAEVNAVVGDEGTVELATLVGYYMLLGYVMNVAGAC